MAVWPDESMAQEESVRLEGAALNPCLRYFWRSQPLHNKSGSAIFETLFLSEASRSGTAGIATLLESPAASNVGYETSLARYSICTGPPRAALQLQLWTPKVGDILPLLDQLSKQKPPAIQLMVGELESIPADLPFIGGWLGWLGYDLAWEIEQLPWLKDDYLPFPVAFWYEPAEFAVLDHAAQRLWLAADTAEGVDRLAQRASRQDGEDTSVAKTRSWTTEHLILETEEAEFRRAVEKAKAHIRAGDVFQVNHSLRFQAQTTMPSWEIYKTLHAINPSPFASYWHTPWGSVVSCSPERLVHLKDQIAQSRPIAGTRPRGKTPVADMQNAQALLDDPKERAEHIMLVDLERNDLGRVCEWGSVQVDELMTIERYSHVMHLVSNVMGKLLPEAAVAELVAALFPGGTITGCPKVRCMEIIETLEPVRRNLFYGSCGYLDRRGRLDLNILIRTLLLEANADEGDCSTYTVWGQVGAGIVADSQPAKEWQESLQKAKAQLLALGLSFVEF